MEESALDVAWNKFIEDEGRAIEKEIDTEVADAVEFALGAPEPDPNELTKFIWADD